MLGIRVRNLRKERTAVGTLARRGNTAQFGNDTYLGGQWNFIGRQNSPHGPTGIAHPELEGQQLDQRVRVVLSWMEENLGTVISLEVIAISLNISVSRLRHLFKEETGIAPLHQLKLMRLLRARELLRGSFLSLKQVANMVGLTDISHFVKDYKQVYGETPGQTRRTHHVD